METAHPLYTAVFQGDPWEAGTRELTAKPRNSKVWWDRVRPLLPEVGPPVFLLGVPGLVSWKGRG